MDIKPIFEDSVYYLEALRYLDDKKIQFTGSAGWNQFYQGASEDSTDPYHPLYNLPLDTPLQYWDNMYKGRVETNNLISDDLRLSWEYRYIGAEFKPRYRQDPAGFDDSVADQRGFNIRGQQQFGGWQLSAEYDDAKRLTNSDYYTRRSDYGIGYYGYSGLDVALNLESLREEYVASSTRSSMVDNRHDKALTSKIYVRNQLTPLSSLWFQIEVDDMEDPNSGVKQQINSLYAKYEYYLASNAKILGEFKTTKFPTQQWESDVSGYPYSNNFARVSFDLTF
jgi:hypothetical protein